MAHPLFSPIRLMFRTMSLPKRFLPAALFAATLLVGQAALAQESTIRKNLAERMPDMPKIESVTATPMTGLYEITFGNEVFYTDAEGNYLIQGQLLDTRGQRNLTQERVDKLSAIDFKDLPGKGSSFTVKRGNGKRQLAVFTDPNCGYCKRLEVDLLKVTNVTVHVYLVPVLGPDSALKSRNVWCAKDKAKVWLDWMTQGVAPAEAKCDTAPIDTNLAFAKKHRITGTPTLVFASGNRIPGAIPLDKLEPLLNESP